MGEKRKERSRQRINRQRDTRERERHTERDSPEGDQIDVYGAPGTSD